MSTLLLKCVKYHILIYSYGKSLRAEEVAAERMKVHEVQSKHTEKVCDILRA